MKIKICKHCKKEKPVSCFGRNGMQRGIQFYKTGCKECVNKIDSELNKKEKWQRYKRWREINKDKIRISDKLRRAVKKGLVIKRDTCQICGTKPENISRMCSHHADYSKPFDVIWICYSCHVWIHKR